jgi:hypothetical protein
MQVAGKFHRQPLGHRTPTPGGLIQPVLLIRASHAPRLPPPGVFSKGFTNNTA